jgi:hypothetical protein
MNTKIASLLVGLSIAGAAAAATAGEISVAERTVNEYGRSSAIGLAVNPEPVLSNGTTVDQDGRSNSRPRQPESSSTVLTQATSASKNGRG